MADVKPNVPGGGGAGERAAGALVQGEAAEQPGLGIGKDLAISERGFLFDPSTGLTYTLNRTGAFLVQRLRSGAASAGALADALVADFEVERERAALDVRDFLQQMRDFGLL